MALDDFQYESAFDDYIGYTDAREIYSGHEAAGWEEWAALFSEIPHEWESGGQELDAFEAFLLAFYPDTSTGPAVWAELREEFYDTYDIDPSEIDWEGWREAMGYND